MSRTGQAFAGNHILAQVIVFGILLVNSGIIASDMQNVQLLQFPYSSETFLVLLLLYFLAFVFPTFLAGQKVPPGTFPLLGLIAFVFIYSALNAAVRYGQPFVYGLIEERRVLGYLIFFPVWHALKARIVSPERVFTYITVAALICVLVAAHHYWTTTLSATIFATTIRPGNTAATMRSDRIILGTPYVLLSYCYSLHRWTRNPQQYRWLVWTIVCVLDLVVLTQTRQIIAAAVLIGLFVLIKRPRLLLIVCTAFSGLYIVVAHAAPLYVSYLVDKYAKLLSSTLTDDVRYSTLQTIFRHNLLWGYGSLSVMWHGGFKRYYGERFYLSDVGVFGTLFRYGVLGVMLVVLYYWYGFRLARRAQNSAAVAGCKSYLLMCLLLNLFIPVIEFLGAYAGIVLAILMFESKRPPGRVLEVHNASPCSSTRSRRHPLRHIRCG